MAAINPLNAYMNATLLIQVATTRLALNAQGLNDFDDFLSLTEKDITDICSNVRKPGGTILNPLYVVGGNVPQMMPNLGNAVGYVHEKRLKMLRYYRLHLQRIQRPFDEASATLARLTNVYALKEADDNEDDDDVTLPAKLTTIDKVRVTLEDIDDYLVRKKGSSGLPLAYIVRPIVDLPDPLEDPGFGIPTYTLEMIRRGPHTGTFYQRDNVTVWNVVRHVTHEGPAWSWVNSYLRTCDGRQAYLALKQHYLGESFTARLRANADRVIDQTFFDGRSRAFTFERYCETLQQAFTDIESTGEAVSEDRKIRALMLGIRDDRLVAAKSQVTATRDLRTSFDSAVNFISQFIDQRRAVMGGQGGANPPRNVSVTNTGAGRGNTFGRGRTGGGRAGRGGGFGRNGGRGRGGRFQNGGRSGGRAVSDQYYSPQDWAQLSVEQQRRVRELRSGRDEQRGVQAVNSRSVRQRTDDGESSAPSAASASTSSTLTTGIGSAMSQRSSRML